MSRRRQAVRDASRDRDIRTLLETALTMLPEEKGILEPPSQNRRHRLARIFLPASSAEDWKPLLAEPDKQWRPGYSAHALAHAWQRADGFPASVYGMLHDSKIQALQDLELLIGLPEHQVPLPPEGGAPSQTDLWVLARGPEGLVSIAVEGKVKETFGPTVGDWLGEHPSPGKQLRLRFLRERLALSEGLDPIRYQLLHRTVSALHEAERFTARHALMLIHSFSPAKDGFDDYTAFVRLFGVAATTNGVVGIGERSGVRLYLGWLGNHT